MAWKPPLGRYQECSCGHCEEVRVYYWQRSGGEWTFCSRECFRDWQHGMERLEKAIRDVGVAVAPQDVTLSGSGSNPERPSKT